MAVSAMFCGYASHWDSQFAQAHARHEAIERRDVLKWWQGGILATPIPLDDPSVGRLAKWVAQARTGATVARSTALWSLPALSKNSVTIIARTQKLDGSEVMLGFGTANTPHTAAAKAVREAILMEVALFETQAWQADRSPIDLKYTAAKIDLYARRCPELLPVSAKQASCPNPAHEEPIYSALTSPIDGRSVWMCRLPSVTPSPISSADHPFI
jgi:ribosomal protein S12 methylthiotransferase accessory factor YcaO